MNALLARHYGTVPLEKLSAADTAASVEASLLRQLDHALSQTQDKVSAVRDVEDGTELAQLVEELGGRSAAWQKLSAARPWLDAWAAGEEDGLELARAGMESLFEEARRA